MLEIFRNQFLTLSVKIDLTLKRLKALNQSSTSQMSGTKLDIEAVKESKHLAPAAFEVDSLDDITALLNRVEPQNGGQGLKVTDADYETVVKNPTPPDSNGRVGIVLDYAESKVVKTPEPVVPADIAFAIRSAVKSAAETAKPMKSSIRTIGDQVMMQETPKPMVSVGSAAKTQKVADRLHVATPPLSSKGKAEFEKKEEQKKEEEEFSMLPETPAEKHLFWKTKLQTLKMSFPDTTIPHNIAELTWEEVRKIYYIQLDRVSINKNVDSYKMMMVIMFMIVEFIGARFVKLDITGFTIHSLRSLHRYERLLIELGEKSYSGFAENWPVEVRLGGMVLVNAIIFVIAKAVFKFSGTDTSEEFFKFFQTLGNQTVEEDLPTSGAGMDTPAPDKGGAGGGLMGIIGSLLGGKSGAGSGGLGDLLGAMMGGNKNAAPKAAEDKGDDASRIKPPKYRRRSQSAKPSETKE